MDKKIFRIVAILLCIDAIILCVSLVLVRKKVNTPNEPVIRSSETNEVVPAANEEAIVAASEATEAPTTEAAETEFTIDMNFVGDLLLATNDGQAYDGCFSQVAQSQPNTYFLANFEDMFLNDDLTVGDCENVFTDNDSLYKSDKGQAAAAEEYAAACAAAEAAGEPTPANTFQAFWFKSSMDTANIISTGGVDVVSIDNNHINDYGSDGKEDTKVALENAGVSWGNSNQTVYKEINGYRIAIIFGTLYYGGQEGTMISNLKEAESQSDFQIIYFHGGTEAIHEPESWKIASCHNMVDNGADLILGDHPHVLQPLEEYNGVNIVYSLGNFVFGGNRHPENRTIVYNHKLTITKDNANGNLTLTGSEYNIIPCYVYTGETNNWQPAIIDDTETANKVLSFMNWEADSPL